MGCPRLGLHISTRAVRSMVPRFVAAFHLDSGQDSQEGLEEGADGLWWLIFPQQAGASGKATHRGQ